jgi:hypothetical protein
MTGKYQYHPVFENLKINEDGSKCYYRNKLLRPSVGKDKKIKYNFLNRSVSAAKLVIEAWHGMRIDLSYTLKRRDFDTSNSHWKNLYWGKKGGNYVKKGANLSRTTQKAIEMLKKGKPNKDIQVELEMDRRRLHTIKNKYINDQA